MSSAFTPILIMDIGSIKRTLSNTFLFEEQSQLFLNLHLVVLKDLNDFIPYIPKYIQYWISGKEKVPAIHFDRLIANLS